MAPFLVPLQTIQVYNLVTRFLGFWVLVKGKEICFLFIHPIDSSYGDKIL